MAASDPLDAVSFLAPLFRLLPRDQALADLVVTPAPTGPPQADRVAAVQAALAHPQAQGANRPELAAGLWLYIGELDRSHTVSQQLTHSAGSFWHAIMHRMEGDFENCLYWYRQASDHPLLRSGSLPDPAGPVRRIRQAVLAASPVPADLIAWQRAEWAALMRSALTASVAFDRP